MTPTGTRVKRCVDKLKKKKKKGTNPYAICTKSTGQSYKTGKPSKSGRRR